MRVQSLVLPAALTLVNRSGFARHSTGLAGYIEPTGSWAIQPMFEVARGFDGVGSVVSDPKSRRFGVIDHMGHWTCPPQFQEILPFGRDMATTIAKKVKSKDDSQPSVLMIDREGKQVGNSWFSDSRGGNEGVFPVASESKWGVVNSKENLIIPFVFDGIDMFYENLAAAHCKTKKVGVIDKAGHWQISPEFHWLAHYSEGLCAASSVNEQGVPIWGYINKLGKWVIPPQFCDAWDFEGGAAQVDFEPGKYKQADFAYIDPNGNFIWKPDR